MASKEVNACMTLRNIHNTFSSAGYIFVGFEGKQGWFFDDINIHLDNSDFLECYGDWEVSWIYINTYQGNEGLSVVLK